MFLFIIFLLIFNILKFEGFDGTLDDIPITLAPRLINQSVNQDPLKPV